MNPYFRRAIMSSDINPPLKERLSRLWHRLQGGLQTALTSHPHPPNQANGAVGVGLPSPPRRAAPDFRVLTGFDLREKLGSCTDDREIVDSTTVIVGYVTWQRRN